MPKRTGDYHSWLLKQLTDPQEAVHYLNAAMEDSQQMFLKALRNIAEAHRMVKVAEEAGLARESLYRTLSEDGNPRLNTLHAVLEAVGLRITVEPIAQRTSLAESCGVLSGQNQPSQQPVDVDLGRRKKSSELSKLMMSGGILVRKGAIGALTGVPGQDEPVNSPGLLNRLSHANN